MKLAEEGIIMGFLQELRSRILAYVEGKDSLIALREWFAPLALEIGSCEDAEARQIVYRMQRSLADESLGYLSENALKQNLFVALFPSPSQSILQESAVCNGHSPVVITGSFVATAEFPSLAFAGVGYVASWALNAIDRWLKRGIERLERQIAHEREGWDD